MQSEVILKVIYFETVSESEKNEINALDKVCFSDVDPKSLKEDFIAVPFGYITARKSGKLVGKIDLFKRNSIFSGAKIFVGGLGGVCVAESERRQGIGTRMCILGLKILKDQGCDVASLNADLDKQAYRVYEGLGFKFTEKKASFENINGKIVLVDGTMFMPLNSEKIYALLMISKETFHYGKGYW